MATPDSVCGSCGCRQRRVGANILARAGSKQASPAQARKRKQAGVENWGRATRRTRQTHRRASERITVGQPCQWCRPAGEESLLQKRRAAKSAARSWRFV